MASGRNEKRAGDSGEAEKAGSDTGLPASSQRRSFLRYGVGGAAAAAAALGSVYAGEASAAAPDPHAASHELGGSDAIPPNLIGAVAKDALVFNVKDSRTVGGTQYAGAAGDGTTDDTAAIQRAIDASQTAYVNEGPNHTLVYGGIVYLPMGVYRTSSPLVWKPRVAIVGAGRATTAIKPLGSSSFDAVFTIPAGPVTDIRMSDLEIVAGGGTGVVNHGIRAQAQAVDAVGGIWGGQLSRLSVQGFPGCGIWLEGGHGGLVHQFLTLSDLLVTSPSGTGARALRMSGQNGQILILNSEFDGSSLSQDGYNVWLGWENGDGGTPPSGAGSPYNVTFVGCTSQNRQNAVFIQAVQQGSWRNGYFENIGHAVTVDGGSQGINVAENILTNGASDGSGTGYIAKASNGSKVVARGNYLVGNFDRSYVVDKQNAWTTLIADESTTCNADDRDIQIGGSNTAQLTAATELYVGPNTTVLVSGSTKVKTLRTHLYTGNRVTIRAQGGPVQFSSRGGNLTLPDDPLTIVNGQCATFVRFDAAASWTLVAVSPAPPLPLGLAGLARWYDAGWSTDDAGGVDGTAVGTFYDRSGNTGSLTASGSVRPLYYSESGLGGRPSLRFDGVDDVMAGASSAGTVKHVFAVVRFDGATFPVYTGLLTDLTTAGVLVGNSGGTVFFDFGGSYRLNRAASATRAAPMNAFGIVTVEYSTGWSVTPQVGKDRTFTGRFGAWRVADLLLYNQVLATADRDAVENYLAAKHSLS